MVPTEDLLASFPPELIASVSEQAARDADLTAHFLQEVGLVLSPGKAVCLPGSLLLELGAAMRLRSWESDGLDLRRAGFPTAEDAILHLFEDATRRPLEPTPPPLCRQVFRFGIEWMAWAGPREFGAEILLEIPDEDALVEAMARFLWDHRASTPDQDGSIGG